MPTNDHNGQKGGRYKNTNKKKGKQRGNKGKTNTPQSKLQVSRHPAMPKIRKRRDKKKKTKAKECGVLFADPDGAE